MQRVLHSHAIKNIREQHSPPCYYEDNAQNYSNELQRFKTAIEQFFLSFEPIFQSCRQELGSKKHLLANILMIRASACRWAISQSPSDSEMYTDSFLRDYILVNTLAHELITRKANFIFDMTLGASIFSVSHHCKDTTVRRAAIDLLNEFPKREGWFDTLVAAKISKWLMDKEEGGKVDGNIPDTARLRLIKHDLGPHKRTAELYCSQLVWKDGNAARVMLPPVTITL
jgi:hypothetical protein